MRLRSDRMHPFDVDEAEAVEIQQRLARLVSSVPPERRIETVTGVYALFLEKADAPTEVASAAITMRLPALELLEARVIPPCPAPVPYKSGFFAFTVGPCLIEVLQALTVAPDVLIFCAHGAAHPRGLGLASHIGVLFDVPSIGCAENLLIGQEPGQPLKRGEWAPIAIEGRTVAAALQTREGVKPLFVSAGHRMHLETAIEVVTGCCPKYRTPEPFREARSRLRHLRHAERWG
jgi:deoxyribonuclease V